MSDTQRFTAQQGNDTLLKYSTWIFWVTTTTLGGLVALGALFGTIAAGDARVVRLYILSLFASGVGALIGALLNLRKVRVLIYGQAIALFAVVTCLMLLVGVILFGGQAPALVDDVPKPDAKASGHVLQHQDYEGHYFTYEPEKAIDGDPETAWRVEGDGEDAYIQLDYTPSEGERGRYYPGAREGRSDKWRESILSTARSAPSLNRVLRRNG